MAVGGDTMRNNAMEARNDPRAKGWELEAMDVYAGAGGDAFTFGTYQQWNNIGTQASSPLQQGVADITSGAHVLPTPNQGFQVPGSMPAAYPNEGIVNFFRTGNAVHYIVRAASAGNYTVVIKYAAYTNTDRFSLQVNGESITFRDMPSTGEPGNTNIGSSAPIPITLKQGQNGIIVRCVQGDATLFSLDFASGTSTPTPTPRRHLKMA
jgi:hypothetical protein